MSSLLWHHADVILRRESWLTWPLVRAKLGACGMGNPIRQASVGVEDPGSVHLPAGRLVADVVVHDLAADETLGYFFHSFCALGTPIFLESNPVDLFYIFSTTTMSDQLIFSSSVNFVRSPSICPFDQQYACYAPCTWANEESRHTKRSV